MTADPSEPDQNEPEQNHSEENQSEERRKGILHWIFGKHPPRPPDPDRSAEAAWLPLWQAQLVLHELWERDVPAVIAEDFTSHLRFGAREPMARIYVMEPRLADAVAVIEEITGYPPAHQGM